MDLSKINLLELALNYIPKQKFIWRQFLTSLINDFGIQTPTYSKDINCYGSIQNIPLNLYEKLGLDFTKDYKIVYSSNSLKGQEQQEQPDLIVYNNSIWSIISNTPWFDYNGWNGVIIVKEKVIQNDN